MCMCIDKPDNVSVMHIFHVIVVDIRQSRAWQLEGSSALTVRNASHTASFLCFAESSITLFASGWVGIWTPTCPASRTMRALNFPVLD
jgi:hypothetical protein